MNYVKGLTLGVFLATKKLAKGDKKKVILVPTNEKSRITPKFWDRFYDLDDNPDKITPKTYEKMLRDAQVYAGLRILILSVVAKGWDIKCDSKNDKLRNEMVDYVYKSFGFVNSGLMNMGGIEDVFEAMMENSLSMGYSVSEVVYDDPAPDGKIYMKKWKVLPMETLKNCFKTDDFGNLEKVIQFADMAKNEQVVFSGMDDFFRLIIWTHNKKGGNWYGESELRRVYKNWFAKDFLLKMWNIALERYGAPYLVCYVEDEDALVTANEHLDKARTKTNFSILNGNHIEVIESKTNGMFGYRDAIKYNDEQIMRGLLIPTLVMGIEETGARALGETHFDLFSWRIQELQTELANTVGTQIKRSIDLNFNDVDAYPYMDFPPLVSKDKKVLADMIVSLIKEGVLKPEEDWIRSFLEIPQPRNAGE